MHSKEEATISCNTDFNTIVEFGNKLKPLKFNRWGIEELVYDLRKEDRTLNLSCFNDIVFDIKSETRLAKLLLSFLSNTLSHLAKQMRDELQLHETHLFEYLISPKFTSHLQNLKVRYDSESPYFIFYYTVLSFVLFDRDYYVYMSSYTLLGLESDSQIEFLSEKSHPVIAEVFEFIRQLIELEDSRLAKCFRELFKEEDNGEMFSNEEIGYDFLRDRLEALLNREYLVYRPNNKNVRHNGFNLFDGRVAVNWDAVHNENEMVFKARFFVIYLHELAHSVRYIYAIGNRIMKPTPARLKGESGYYLEKSLFGVSISKNIGCIDERIAKLILNEENYYIKRFLRKDAYTYQQYLGYTDYKPHRACIHENAVVKTKCGPCLSLYP